MTQAMRTAALVELVSSLGLDPHKVPDDVLRVILDNALKLARAHGYRLPDAKPDGTAPRRQATGERSAVAGDGPLVRFGRDKGKPIADVDDLSWYRAALQTSVEDPSKARFLEQNRAHLEEVDAELRARGGR